VTRTVGFATLGCRLNQVDTQEIQTALEARGFRTVPADAPADVVVVNTCTVTARAEFSDRQAIHRARRLNPHARIVVTGCWAQTDPQAVARQAGVDLVVGNADKLRLPLLLDRLLASPGSGAWSRPRWAAWPAARARSSRCRTAASTAARSASCPGRGVAAGAGRWRRSRRKCRRWWRTGTARSR
jgi:tRNA A37 methylthiotransferase MiaB